MAKRDFPYLAVAILVPAVPSLIAHYGFGAVFLFPPWGAWVLVCMAAASFAGDSWLAAHAAKHVATLDIGFNRVTLNGREHAFDFSLGGAVIADARALGDAIDMALSDEMGRFPLKARTDVVARVLVGDSPLTVIERGALEQVLAERFAGQRIVEMPSA